MPEFKLLKEMGLIKFDVSMALDFDDEGNIEAHEFYTDDYRCENACDLVYGNNFCDESHREEWVLFSDEIVNLFENKDFFKKIKKLKSVNDSCFFTDEGIDVILIEED